MCVFMFFFQNFIFQHYSQVNFQYLCISFFFNIQFKLHYIVLHASISYWHKLVFLALKTFQFFFSSQRHLIFSYYFYAFSLGANKKDLLFVTYRIISLLPIGLNSFILRLFQHVMSLYMNMCWLITFHINMLTLFKRLLTKE
jgi:hypothetical protein